MVQLNGLKKLTAETNEQQKQSIAAISAETMDAVVENSLTENTEMKAFIVNDLFEDVANAAADRRRSRRYGVRDR